MAELRRRDAVNATRPPRARMRFIVWTINDGSDLCTLVGVGVDGIITDEPGHLRAIVKHWGQPGYCPDLGNTTTALSGRGCRSAARDCSQCKRVGENLAASLLHDKIISDLFNPLDTPCHRDGSLGIGRLIHKPA